MKKKFLNFIITFCSNFIEILVEPAVVARLSDTKAAGEVRTLDTFYTMLQNEPDRAFYGYVFKI